MVFDWTMEYYSKQITVDTDVIIRIQLYVIKQFFRFTFAINIHIINVSIATIKCTGLLVLLYLNIDTVCVPYSTSLATSAYDVPHYFVFA